MFGLACRDGASLLKRSVVDADPWWMRDHDPQCPVCSTTLQPAVHETAMIWACPECRGTFMSRAQLDAITANESVPRSRDELLEAIDGASVKLPLLDHIRRTLDCPACDEAMQRSVLDGESGIGIDTCASCGVWLDRGELERAEAWREARRAGLERG